MYAARLAPLPLKPYAFILATAGALAFMTGATLNFVYARNNPAADPYVPHLSVDVPVRPVPDVPFDPKRVKVLPILNPGPALEQPALISDAMPISRKVLPTDRRTAAKVFTGTVAPAAAVSSAADPADAKYTTMLDKLFGSEGSSKERLASGLPEVISDHSSASHMVVIGAAASRVIAKEAQTRRSKRVRQRRPHRLGHNRP